MSIRDRPAPEQQSVVSFYKTLPEQNNNDSCSPQERKISSAKRVYFRRRIPPEIFNDLPESSVDPPSVECSTTDRCGGGVTCSGGFVSDSRTCGRAITVIGSPVRPIVFRSKSVDYCRLYLESK
ncbi:uncharacterized protein TNCV_4526481 [Trichonephila clavipes]|nr:uncharacterized protein TNCV_4526481 [Trichonephila clavipes]